MKDLLIVRNIIYLCPEQWREVLPLITGDDDESKGIHSIADTLAFKGPYLDGRYLPIAGFNQPKQDIVTAAYHAAYPKGVAA